MNTVFFFQKVFYKVRPLNGPAIPDESVTRSCSAGVCEEKNDFLNCTDDKLENPGCSQRFCCEDNDLCNYTSTIHHAYFRPVFCVLVFIGVAHSLSRHTGMTESLVSYCAWTLSPYDAISECMITSLMNHIHLTRACESEIKDKDSVAHTAPHAINSLNAICTLNWQFKNGIQSVHHQINFQTVSSENFWALNI